MTNEELERLEVRASAATPGPWKTDPECDDMNVEAGDGYMVADCAIFGFGEIEEARSESQCTANATFIAAANPAAILSLIQRVREAEAHVERLQMAVGEATKTAWAQGRAEALEDAAKVARSFDKSLMSMTREDVQACEIAAAIRALGEKAG